MSNATKIPKPPATVSPTHVSNIGAKGRTVLPQAVREALQVREGDSLLYVLERGQVRLTTRRQLAEELYGSLAEDDGRDFTQELLDERRAEVASPAS